MVSFFFIVLHNFIEIVREGRHTVEYIDPCMYRPYNFFNDDIDVVIEEVLIKCFM